MRSCRSLCAHPSVHMMTKRAIKRSRRAKPQWARSTLDLRTTDRAAALSACKRACARSSTEASLLPSRWLPPVLVLSSRALMAAALAAAARPTGREVRIALIGDAHGQWNDLASAQVDRAAPNLPPNVRSLKAAVCSSGARDLPASLPNDGGKKDFASAGSRSAHGVSLCRRGCSAATSQDVAALRSLAPDLACFVGDFGNEDLEAVSAVARASGGEFPAG